MSKRISILHFLSNYIIVLLPIFTLCVMGPTEIYFGNYKELGFTYQEFGWKFLFFSFLITTLLTLILSFLPDKIQKYFLSVIYWIGIAGYLQTMFLNKQLDLMGVSAESYSATRMKTVLNACLWFVLLVLILFFTMYPKTKMHNILSITSGIIFGMQLVGFLSLFPTADEAAFSYPTEEKAASSAVGKSERKPLTKLLFLIQQKNYVLTEVNNIPFPRKKILYYLYWIILQ